MIQKISIISTGMMGDRASYHGGGRVSCHYYQVYCGLLWPIAASRAIRHHTLSFRGEEGPQKEKREKGQRNNVQLFRVNEHSRTPPFNLETIDVEPAIRPVTIAFAAVRLGLPKAVVASQNMQNTA